MRAYELNEDFGVPTPSIKEIADKHDVSVTEIEAELKKGTKVEQEHVKNDKLADEIARDHLAELPDYYTRLTKMEKEAKKELEEK